MIVLVLVALAVGLMAWRIPVASGLTVGLLVLILALVAKSRDDRRTLTKVLEGATVLDFVALLVVFAVRPPVPMLRLVPVGVVLLPFLVYAYAHLRDWAREAFRPHKAAMAEMEVAIPQGDVEKIEALLAQVPSLVQCRTRDYLTPMTMACECGQEAMVRRLVEAGARNTTQGAFVAARRGHEGIVRLLIDQGVDLSDGRLLHWSIRFRQAGVARLILARAGRLVDTPDEAGKTPLILASHKPLLYPFVEAEMKRWLDGGNREMADMLLSQGADVNAVSQAGETALIHATEWWPVDLVERLVSAGADVAACSKNGITPLKMAVKGKNAAVVEYLSSLGGGPQAW